MNTETTSSPSTTNPYGYNKRPPGMHPWKNPPLHPQEIANEALLIRVASLMADGVLLTTEGKKLGS